jgi:hypothetical protein
MSDESDSFLPPILVKVARRAGSVQQMIPELLVILPATVAGCSA